MMSAVSGHATRRDANEIVVSVGGAFSDGRRSIRIAEGSEVVSAGPHAETPATEIDEHPTCYLASQGTGEPSI